MNIPREVVKQWLAALVATEDLRPSTAEECMDMRDAAISSCRAALAAQHWHDLYVAKCQELNDERARLGGQIEGLEQEAALLVAPTQAQPLTDEQIEDIAKPLLNRGHQWEGLQPWVYQFARAIEASRGITKAQP